jgi:hypothetical protein
MARTDSHKAIGGVSALLREHLTRRGFNVTVGKPELASEGESAAKLNLFLYETMMDASLRNAALEPNAPPPLWLILRYLLTAFDEAGISDSIDAHQLLGQGMMALQELNFLQLDASTDPEVRRMLESNPEPLKITFDESGPELIAKLMQGSDETYRLSAALQVRPVLILSALAPRPGSPVGMDLSRDPPNVIGSAGLQIIALPGLGPRIERIEPPVLAPGDNARVFGSGLSGAIEALLDGYPLRVTGQTAESVTIEMASALPPMAGQDALASGLGPSAGERALTMRVSMPNGRSRSSNVLGVALLPIVTQANLAGQVLTIDGTLLGSNADEILVVLLDNGLAVRSFDMPQTSADQRRLIVNGVAVPAGRYAVLVMVNSQSARRTPFLQVN